MSGLHKQLKHLRLLVLCILFGFLPTDLIYSSAISLQDQFASGYFIARPTDKGIIVFGVTGRQSKPNYEIESAREDAAHKVALFQGIKGRVVTNIQEGGGFLDYAFNVSTEFKYDEEYEKYKDALTYDDSMDLLRIGNVVLIRFTYPQALPVIPNYESAFNMTKPWWIIKQPQEISGYVAGIGFAKKHSKLRDTINKSYENAITALISRQSTYITTKTSDNTIGNKTTTLQINEGELVNFLVIEMWVEPVTQSVWTLAIAGNK
jgi:hypothetical protein